MRKVKIKKSALPASVIYVKYCDTFFSKFLGLMFSKKIEPDEGILIVENNESRIATSIHMMFMNYDIAVLWLDRQMVIVDKVLARKWCPFYISKVAAQYVVELHSSKFSEYSIGEQLIISD